MRRSSSGPDRKSPSTAEAGQGVWPLEGKKVLDLTQNVAGPYAAMILAELGAKVTKVEPPSGDATRTWGPPFWEKHSPTYLSLNRNKERVTLDLKTPAGQKALWSLLGDADGMIVSSRPGAMEKIGLDYESVVRKSPVMVYGEISAFGDAGPRAPEPGYDPLVQALSGIMAVTGRPGEAPVRVGVSIIDMASGMWLALGMLSAFMMRTKSAKPHRVSVSLYDTGIGWMTYHMSSFWASGVSPRGWGSGTAMVAPYEAFQTVDGWVIVAAGNDGLFRRLCGVLGHTEWVEDPRYRTNADRVKNRSTLVPMIAEMVRKMKTPELERLLKEAGIPAAQVRSVEDALSEPQLGATGIIQTVPDAPISGFKSVGIPLKIDGKRPALRSVPF